MRLGGRGLRTARFLIPIALLALAFALPRLFQPERSTLPVREPAERRTTSQPDAAGDRAIADAFRDQRSGVWVESSGIVEKLLSDDLKGSPHQRFLLRLDTGQSLLFAHNIDLAPRVPARPGDRIRFRGQYEWNDRGGVLHWTHDDPHGGPGGWIAREETTYR